MQSAIDSTTPHQRPDLTGFTLLADQRISPQLIIIQSRFHFNAVAYVNLGKPSHITVMINHAANVVAIIPSHDGTKVRSNPYYFAHPPLRDLLGPIAKRFAIEVRDGVGFVAMHQPNTEQDAV